MLSELGGRNDIFMYLFPVNNTDFAKPICFQASQRHLCNCKVNFSYFLFITEKFGIPVPYRSSST